MRLFNVTLLVTALAAVSTALPTVSTLSVHAETTATEIRSVEKRIVTIGSAVSNQEGINIFFNGNRMRIFGAAAIPIGMIEAVNYGNYAPVRLIAADVYAHCARMMENNLNQAVSQIAQTAVWTGLWQNTADFVAFNSLGVAAELALNSPYAPQFQDFVLAVAEYWAAAGMRVWVNQVADPWAIGSPMQDTITSAPRRILPWRTGGSRRDMESRSLQARAGPQLCYIPVDLRSFFRNVTPALPDTYGSLC